MTIQTGVNTRISGYISSVLVTLYVMDCPECGVVFGINVDMEERRRKDGRSFSCPNGHSGLRWTETEEMRQRKKAERLADQTEQLNRRLANAQEDARAAHASLVTTKGHLTRVKKRADAGVCLHCNRTFANVGRHVAHMHPEATQG